MKLKATKSQIKNGYNKIIGIGYCNAQHLLKFKNPFAYSSGAYGWNCDYYDIEGVCISTGYSYLNNQNVKKYDYDLLRSYEDKAQVIAYDNTIEWQIKEALINQLLNDFIKEVIK